MVYVVQTLLGFWNSDPDRTIDVGREALSGLVGCTDAKKIAALRTLVVESFDIASGKPRRRSSLGIDVSGPRSSSKMTNRSTSKMANVCASFLSASDWWENGWLPLLKLPA